MSQTDEKIDNSFLRSRTYQFWVGVFFLPVWCIGLMVHLTARQNSGALSSTERGVLGFVLTAAGVTFCVLASAGLVQMKSRAAMYYFRFSTVSGELRWLTGVSLLQTVAAIVLTATFRRFTCIANAEDPRSEGTCRTLNMGIMITSWIVAVLFGLYTINYAWLARRFTAEWPVIWNTVVWGVKWDSPERYMPQKRSHTSAPRRRQPQRDLEKGQLGVDSIHWTRPQQHSRPRAVTVLSSLHEAPLSPQGSPDIPEWLRNEPAVFRQSFDADLPRYSDIYPFTQRTQVRQPVYDTHSRPTPTPTRSRPRREERNLVEMPRSYSHIGVPRLQAPPAAVRSQRLRDGQPSRPRYHS